MKKYLFIDRDGTLICEPEDFQVDTLGKLQLTRDVIPALLQLKSIGYRFVMVSNQDGLGTESFPEEEFIRPHNMMLSLFSSQGIEFEQVLICPHTANQNCLCRKPHLGLLRPLIANSEIDYESSFVIGDRESDLLLAKNLGVKGICYFDKENKSKTTAFTFESVETFTWPQIVELVENRQRVYRFHRETSETKISCQVDLNAKGKTQIETGIGFFDHMLEQIARHGGLDLQIQASGDLQVDAHHTVEDVAIVLSEVLRQSIGDKVGLQRYGFLLPMDEAEAQVCLDLGGRFDFSFSGEFNSDYVGELPTQMVSHFFRTIAEGLRANLHMKFKGENDHHKVEGLFKSFARTLKQAMSKDGSTQLASTKGML